MSKTRAFNTKSAKLTAGQVAEIRARIANGETQSSLCELFDVSIGQIGRIARNESWRALPKTLATMDDITKSQLEVLVRAGLVPGVAAEPSFVMPSNKKDWRSEMASTAYPVAAPEEKSEGDGLSKLQSEAAKVPAVAAETKLTDFITDKGDSK